MCAILATAELVMAHVGQTLMSVRGSCVKKVRLVSICAAIKESPRVLVCNTSIYSVSHLFLKLSSLVLIF